MLCASGKKKDACAGDSGGIWVLIHHARCHIPIVKIYDALWIGLSQRSTKLLQLCDPQLGALWNHLLGSRSWLCSARSNCICFCFCICICIIFVIISWRAECADPGEFRELQIQSQGFRESTHGCPNISHGSKTSLIGCDFNLLKKHFHWRKKTISLKLISSGTPPHVSSSDTSSEESKHRKNYVFSIFAMFSFLE